ncbi:unnamed protein product [Rotaria sordida]|uniref:Uncharacterized protein n=1 Tax=Rotaria sordida TaxID=392033 RepID=A0A814R432_9BILA|nr:unnamed protein product [Rotaria sordida]CAF3898899.1 unnamed protein product [Rotaria sordida]
MGSIVEGIYFQKLMLCLPIHTDQFLNSMAIQNSGVGQSLFEPSSLLESFLKPHDYHDYTFLASSVTTKLSAMWRNTTYEQAARLMSLEMKHASGVKRTIEEIELLISLNGDLSRYAPFHSTLPFYQRYMLDLVFVFIVLPMTIILYLFVRCCKRSRKKKVD